MIYDRNDELLYQVNIPGGVSLDSLKGVMAAANDPIVFNNVGHRVYWNESVRFSELKDVMQDLINSFISETVINSASVPVVMTDSTRTEVIRYQRVDSTAVAEPERLQSLLAGMASSNEPIEVDLTERRPPLHLLCGFGYPHPAALLSSRSADTYRCFYFRCLPHFQQLSASGTRPGLGGNGQGNRASIGHAAEFFDGLGGIVGRSRGAGKITSKK